MRILCCVLSLTALLHAQDEPAATSGVTPPPAQAAAPAAPAARPPAGAPRAYNLVITKDAKTSKGVFTVHEVGDRYYYEIPVAELGKEFLWITRIARNTIGSGYGGERTGTHVVRWERRGNRVLLRKLNYEVSASLEEPMADAVEAAKNPAIVATFNIETLGIGDAPVIEITRLFTTDVPEFSARVALRARTMDPARSFIERITPFPTNIEAEATQTYTTPTDAPPAPNAPSAMRPGSGSVVLHFSMLRLPQQPMRPRLSDARVGYFVTATTDYSRPDQTAVRRTFINRWRLEKKDPSAAVSEPVTPIVFYLDPATPRKWIPYLKKGIECWQAAFEAAGFKNAIIAREAPSKQEAPSWSPEDARYSVIRWLPSSVENATGRSVADPRTGEILNAEVLVHHNVMQLVRDWYFIQVSPLDARAKHLPFPDELMGELLAYVLAHEVGHTLGFPHNLKGSAEYPAEKLRDPEWLRTMGHTPTIMDYVRFNYVVQPEDKIDPLQLIPRIGPYDVWATKWGYAPIPSAETPDDERKVLDEWARQQDDQPWLRFSTARSTGADAGENAEAVGDSDAVASTRLGLKNVDRVMASLLDATSHPGEDWDELAHVYARLLGQWLRELTHVTQIIGGYDSRQTHAGQKEVRFIPVPRARQAAAMEFLNQKAFATPTTLLPTAVLRRIEPDGALERIRNSQVSILTSLLSSQRLGRLIEQEAVDGENVYRPLEFLGKLRAGVWAEIYASQVKIDAYRRNLQRGYLEVIARRLSGPARARDDQRLLLRGELRTLTRDVSTALRHAADETARLHLEDIREYIATILDPKFLQTDPPGNVPMPLDDTHPDLCWPDLAIGNDEVQLQQADWIQ